MGRKRWSESVSQKGPGRKAKKQGDPKLPAQLQKEDQALKKVNKAALGGRAKQRARKRLAKETLAKAVKQSSKKNVRKSKGADYSSVPPPKEMLSFEEDAPKHAKVELFDGSDGNGGK